MLSLPLLESMLPARTPLVETAANPNAAKTRFLGIFSAHGWPRFPDNTGYWIPEAGTDFKMPMILEPLTPFRDQLLIFSGWDSTAAMPPPGLIGGDHVRGSCALTGVSPRKT